MPPTDLSCSVAAVQFVLPENEAFSPGAAFAFESFIWIRRRSNLAALCRRLAAPFIVLVAMITGATGVAELAAGERPQQAFVRNWEGRRVIVKRALFTLVYNERGLLGNTASGKRDGLIVVTPFEGVYFQFDGRQGRNDVVGRDPQRMVDAVADAYQPDSLDVRSYRKVEPVSIARYDAGVELVVKKVRLDRDTVKLTFVQPTGPDGPDDPVTSLTIKWPMPLSKSFAERDQIERMIRPFVDVTPIP